MPPAARDGLGEIAEARKAAVEHRADDRAGPSAADQFHGVVELRAKGGRREVAGVGDHILHVCIITESKALDKGNLTTLQ